MRWVCLVMLALAVCSGQALAQEQPSSEEIKRLNEQLKAAQDRKNELAAENEKLIARVNDLQKQVDTANSTLAERTFYWRSTHAAWEQFLSRYPVLMGRWQAFLQSALLDAPGGTEWMKTE